MRIPFCIALLSGSLSLLTGCGQSPAAPALPAATDPGLPVSVVSTLTPGVNQTVALYHLQIDPDTLAVSVEPVIDRQAAASPQAKAFDLELWGAILDGLGNPFLTIRGTDQFNVTGVTDLPGLGKQVNFTHKHPIAAPNYNGGSSNFYDACADCLCYSDVPPNPNRPSKRQECLRAKEFGNFRPNALNRSDLSYAGRAVFLTNVSGDSQTYFTDITADTSGVVNPDGYLDVRSVINATGDTRHPGLTNTVFPYILLVDESKNNRQGVTNGGSPTGNYLADPHGWQRSNIGPQFRGWTGYDVLHAGQTSVSSVILKATPSGGYSTYVALVVKYTDPRGASSLFWRWPTPTADPLQFAYRMPYGALDASVVIPPAQTINIGSNPGATASVTVGVRDWDRNATAHTDADLSDVTDVKKVQPGSIGNCTVTVSIPAFSATPFTLNYQTGTGLPGDESEYSGMVTNTLGTAGQGTHLGLVRVVDPENGDPNAGTYRFGIDNPPTYTAASPAKALPIVTYQVVKFNVQLSVPVISDVDPSGCPTPVAGGEGAGLSFSATATNAPVSWSWNFGGGATPNTSTDTEPFVVLGAPGQYNGTVTATNAAGTSAEFDFCYVVAAAAPVITSVRSICPLVAGSANATGIVFRATATGSPTSYAWDFGAGATITGGGTTANVTVTLGSQGVYSGTVTATNAQGTSDEYVFCYEVDF